MVESAIARPSRWVNLRLGLLWLWCVLAAVLLWPLLPFQRYRGDDIYSFVLIWLWWTLPVAALIVSLGLRLFRPDAVPFARTVIAWHLGAIATVSPVALYLGVGDSSYVIVETFLGLTIGIPALLLAPRHVLHGIPAPRARTAIKAAIGTVAGVLLLWSQANIFIITMRTKELVGDRPYCMDVEDGDVYRRVSWIEDLNGVTMQTPYQSGGQEEYQLVYHLVLYVDDQLYNWSYMAQDFQPITASAPFHRACTPVVRFLDTV